MYTVTPEDIEHCFQNYFGVDRQTLLQPVEGGDPCGEYLKYNGVYETIRQSRLEDDPSLPQGVWTHDLKRADWPEVASVALDALIHKSKDIQLGIWLLESNIQMNGFQGIAPCCLLLAELCKEYWEGIHPRMVDDDIEFRINPFIWANEKLVPLLRLIPLTITDDNQPGYNFSDWLSSQANEKLLSGKTVKKEDIEGLLAEDFSHAMSATSTEYFAFVYQVIDEAMIGIDYLMQELDERCGDEAPGFHNLVEVLREIQGLVRSELAQRGISADENLQQGDTPANNDESYSGETVTEHAVLRNGLSEMQAARQGAGQGNRYETYIQLEQAAHYLMQIDPHSPAPYLILQACRWGNMDTRELYRELFVECQGQINIFELLGVGANHQEPQEAMMSEQEMA